MASENEIIINNCGRCGHIPSLSLTVTKLASGYGYECQCGRLIPRYVGLSAKQARELWNSRNPQVGEDMRTREEAPHGTR